MRHLVLIYCLPQNDYLTEGGPSVAPELPSCVAGSPFGEANGWAMRRTRSPNSLKMSHVPRSHNAASTRFTKFSKYQHPHEGLVSRTQGNKVLIAPKPLEMPMSKTERLRVFWYNVAAKLQTARFATTHTRATNLSVKSGSVIILPPNDQTHTRRTKRRRPRSGTKRANRRCVQ